MAVNRSLKVPCGKRAFDLVCGAVIAVVTLPLQAAVAAVVAVDVGRPILFRQVRPGLNNVPFRMTKFRTMRDLRSADGALLPDEQRITPVGKALRSTSLDELPEIYNVITGDMSLVGPRPLLMEYVERYTHRQARRSEVRPGITGLAQVSGRNNLSWEEKLELDVHYVENMSFALDMKILARTLWSVVRRTGISADGHATAPEFRGSGIEMST